MTLPAKMNKHLITYLSPFHPGRPLARYRLPGGPAAGQPALLSENLAERQRISSLLFPVTGGLEVEVPSTTCTTETTTRQSPLAWPFRVFIHSFHLGGKDSVGNYPGDYWDVVVSRRSRSFSGASSGQVLELQPDLGLQNGGFIFRYSPSV